jgi:hypothetical protein
MNLREEGERIIRVGIDLDSVIMNWSYEIINNSEEEFKILREWAGPPPHKGKRDLICVTARNAKKNLPVGYSGMEDAISTLNENNILFDEYYFIGGSHKFMTAYHIDYLVDNGPMIYERWVRHRDESKIIVFDAPENRHINCTHRVKRLSEIIEIIESDWEE